mmetsp:Transcript_28/g.71  ORF Transcript_28/g.71 Transcript_28/m.71 type:complete len:251 (-) Transcript_28:442-1194(-)
MVRLDMISSHKSHQLHVRVLEQEPCSGRRHGLVPEDPVGDEVLKRLGVVGVDSHADMRVEARLQDRPDVRRKRLGEALLHEAVGVDNQPPPFIARQRHEALLLHLARRFSLHVEGKERNLVQLAVLEDRQVRAEVPTPPVVPLRLLEEEGVRSLARDRGEDVPVEHGLKGLLYHLQAHHYAAPPLMQLLQDSRRKLLVLEGVVGLPEEDCIAPRQVAQSTLAVRLHHLISPEREDHIVSQVLFADQFLVL